MLRNIIITASLIISISFLGINKANATAKSEIKEASVHVDGNCGNCKTRIENAANIKGVKKATWDKTTDILTVIYDASKTNLDEIEKSIALAGHDTPLYKANDDTYSKLPPCCAYRDKNAQTH